MSLIDWFAARRKDQFVGKVSQDTDEEMVCGLNVQMFASSL